MRLYVFAVLLVISTTLNIIVDCTVDSALCPLALMNYIVVDRNNIISVASREGNSTHMFLFLNSHMIVDYNCERERQLWIHDRIALRRVGRIE